MKTTMLNTRNIILLILIMIGSTGSAQTGKSTVGVLNMNSTGLNITEEQMGSLFRSEIEKLDSFGVIDKFDADYFIKQKNLDSNCKSKMCLIEIGKALNAEYMFSGGAELIGNQIVVTLRQINVSTGLIEKTQVNEYLNLPNEIKNMISITVKEMYRKKVDEILKNSLTSKSSLDNSINNPEITRLNCSGPRMGVTFLSGTPAKVIQAPRNEGGFDGYPTFFQFGYQWEKQYLNEGRLQALFEFIPVVSGLEQGMFVPSFTCLNGIRDNKNGWEFAFGPTITFNRVAEGYYDTNGAWHLKTNWYTDTAMTVQDLTTRMDSRGRVRIISGFVFAFGKTFRSGNINFPVNIFINPNKDGIRFGVSFGYNAKKK